MVFDPERLRAHRFEPVLQSYTERDAILYALGLGLPLDPLDTAELPFVLEDRLVVLPSFAVTLASLGMWVREPDLCIDWVRLLHGSQAATFHSPLPPAATVRGEARIKSLYDRGADKGAVCVVERTISDDATGKRYCTLDQTIIMRGNGGWGGDVPPRHETLQAPDRAPDHRVQIAVSPRAALIYRLSGDLNPLHADPAVAVRAGFDRPILHGLATYGIAGAAIVKQFCGGMAARMKSLSVRFSGVVYPGDRLTVSMWGDGNQVFFSANAGDRPVLDQGVATIAVP